MTSVPIEVEAMFNFEQIVQSEKDFITAQKLYLVEHIIFSMHFLAFTALTVVLLWPVYFVLGIKPTTLNLVVASGKFLLDIVYMFFAVRVFYREPFWKALLRAPVLFAGYFVIYIIVFLAALAGVAGWIGERLRVAIWQAVSGAAGVNHPSLPQAWVRRIQAAQACGREGLVYPRCALLWPSS